MREGKGTFCNTFNKKDFKNIKKNMRTSQQPLHSLPRLKGQMEEAEAGKTGQFWAPEESFLQSRCLLRHGGGAWFTQRPFIL